METNYIQEDSSHYYLIIENTLWFRFQYCKRIDKGQAVYPSYDCPLNQHRIVGSYHIKQVVPVGLAGSPE